MLSGRESRRRPARRLVPVFAAFLKVAYLGSGRYFTQHLVFSVHNHSFLFVMFFLGAVFSLLGLVWSPIQRVGHDAINLWVPIYMYVSLLQTYREGYATTLVKFLVLSFFYVILFALSVALAVVTGFMTL